MQLKYPQIFQSRARLAAHRRRLDPVGRMRAVVFTRGQLGSVGWAEPQNVGARPDALTSYGRRSIVKLLDCLHGSGFPGGVRRFYVAVRGARCAGDGNGISESATTAARRWAQFGGGAGVSQSARAPAA